MGAGEASGSIDVKSSVMERVRAIHAQRLASEGGERQLHRDKRSRERWCRRL